MKKKSNRRSAQLPIRSYEWAVARLNEDPSDAYARKIKMEQDLRPKLPGPLRPGI